MEYILLKDLPEAKAGSVFIYHAPSELYYLDGNLGLCSCGSSYINRFPEWFQRVEDKPVDVAPKYTESDLVTFGNYLLSDKRKESFHGGTYSELMERLKQVHDNDLANWKKP